MVLTKQAYLHHMVRALRLSSQTSWERLPIYKIERVENGCQMAARWPPWNTQAEEKIRKALAQASQFFSEVCFSQGSIQYDMNI